MSWGHIIAARDRRDLPFAPKAVLSMLATYANPAGLAWPSTDTLAADCAVSPSQVRGALRQLINASVIVDTGQKQGRHRVFDLSILLGKTPPPSDNRETQATIERPQATIERVLSITRNSETYAGSPVETLPLPAWAKPVLNRHLSEVQLNMEV